MAKKMPMAKAKKNALKGKAKGGKRKEIDWAADVNFDANRAMILVEHSLECPIFQVKAEEFQTFLTDQIPDRMFQLVRNNNGKVIPRPGAFEIGFSQTARTSVHNLWSGIDKGPPRRDKFPPDFAMLLPEVRAVLKKFYADLTDLPQEDEFDEEYIPPPAEVVTIAEEETGREESA